MKKEVKAKRTATRTRKGVEKEGDMETLVLQKNGAVLSVRLWKHECRKNKLLGKLTKLPGHQM